MTKRLFQLCAAALLAAPAASRAQIAVLSSTVEEKSVSAGGMYSANIVISNPGKETQTVRIYKTDYRFSCDGTSNFDDAGTTKRSNANWISLQSERVTIPGGSQVTVPYAVKVPAGDSLAGTFWSTVMVEPVAAAPNAAGLKQTVAIGAVMRYAVQIATHIQSTGSRTVRFDKPVLSRTSAGLAKFDVNVFDEGERGYRPTLWIEVYDAEGTLRAKARQTRGLLYPGTSLHQSFDLGALPAGSYKALVFADSGDDAVFAAQYTITY
jgi:hypothetical protein